MSLLADKIDKGLPPLKVAVVHPTEPNSLKGAIKAAELGIIEPIFIGPEQEITRVAQDNEIDIGGRALINVDDDKNAAIRAVSLVHEGQAEAIMKGLISTGSFLKPIVSGEQHLRVSGKRVSHVFRMSDSDYHKPLYISDAAVNNFQDVKIKMAITQNAIDAFRAVEGHEPKVALLSATEKPVEGIPSSMEAAEIKELAQQGMITGGIVDGPFAIDNAVSAESARLKGISSAVAGDADILIVPSLEAGNILYKALCFLDDAKRGGIVVGAKVPVILTSRAADIDTRVDSSAMALLHARNSAS